MFAFLKGISEAARCYSQIIGELDIDGISHLDKPLEDLDHIQGAPSYMLLLYLWLQRETLALGLSAAVARFVLCTLEEASMNREAQVDLWRLDKHKKYIWAREYRDQYVHQLGNLTISGYNSALGTKSFVEKRDRTDKQGRTVGYNNGLSLNDYLAIKDTWSITDIKKRTDDLAKKLINLFAYDGEAT